MSPTIEKDVAFIQTDLLPEMVFNRCFCEPGSREFVEFDSAEIESIEKSSYHLNFSFYRATVTVRFSGEPETFNVVIKLLPENCFSGNDASLALAFDGFLNEEILWNKGTLQYGKDFLPKFYAADMGKYGRPVIVVEDLQKNGFERVLDREFNQEEVLSIAKLIGNFHGRGMKLKQNEFSIFREFFAKFQDITFSEAGESETRKRLSKIVEELKSMNTKEENLSSLEKVLGSNPYVKCKENLKKDDFGASDTICQGLLLRENIWFRKKDGNELEVRVFDWQRVKRGRSSFDLATVLIQSATDQWSNFLEAYTKAVQKEQPSVSKNELIREITDTALLYALVILSNDTRQLKLSQVFNVLEYDFS